MNTSLNLAKNQKGMTAIGWLVVISLIGFFSLLAMIMLPIYMGNMEVRTALKNIAGDPEVHTWSRQEIRNSFSRRLITGAWSADVKAKNLKIKRNKDRSQTLRLQYQKKEHFAGNIYIVVEFDETVAIPREK